MKKIITGLFILFTTCAQAQVLQPHTNFGDKFNRLQVDSSLGIPKDTFALQSFQKAVPHIAVKNGIVYLWSISLQQWVINGGGSGGGTTTLDITYSATASQTDFTTPATITDIKRIQVFRNGVENQVTQISSNTVRIPQAAGAGDRIKIVQLN